MMNSSFFNSLFSSVIGEWTNYSNSVEYTQNQLSDVGAELLNYSSFAFNNLYCLDIPYICAVITFILLFYFFISLLRQVFSR